MTLRIVPLQFPTDPLAIEVTAALATLSVCAEAAERCMETAEASKRIPPYQRERFRRLGVAIAAAVDGLRGELGR